MTENKFLSTKEAAQILDLSVRRVVWLCNQETFTGAIKEGRNWKIPKEASGILLNTELPLQERK